MNLRRKCTALIAALTLTLTIIMPAGPGIGVNAEGSQITIAQQNKPGSKVAAAAVPYSTPTQIPVAGNAQTPEPPRVTIDTTYSEPAGSTITVNQGDDLQEAINLAQPGDIIELQAGARFTGNFVLPEKTGDDWIVIRSSSYGSLPPPGTRISPSDAANMPMIITDSNTFAISTAPGAHHYRLVGLEVTCMLGGTWTLQYGIIGFGNDAVTSLDKMPHDLIVDRCYVHGNAKSSTVRGITLNGARCSVVDSYVCDFHLLYNQSDSQAICGWYGPGPFKITNNFLSAAAECIMFGGAGTTIANVTPSDIEIRNNHLYHPMDWKKDWSVPSEEKWRVKNLFELKHAQRVVFEGNVLENNWVQADQRGYAILITMRNEDGAIPWAVTRDIKVSKNLIRNSALAFEVAGLDGYNAETSVRTDRVEFSDNLFYDLKGNELGIDYYFAMLVENNPSNLVINHNTFENDQGVMMVCGEPTFGFTFTNNIMSANTERHA